MKKLKIYLVPPLLAIGVICLYFSLSVWKNAQEEAPKIRQDQNRAVLYLVNHYDGIEKIKFTSFQSDPLIGSRDYSAIVNDSSVVSIDVGIQSGEMDTGYHPDSFHLQSKEVEDTITSLDGYRVEYYKEDTAKQIWKIFGLPVRIFGIIFLVLLLEAWQRNRKSVKKSPSERRKYIKKPTVDFVVILLAVLFAFSGVFLVFSRNNREVAQETASQFYKEQERISLYLENHYEGIEKIEFTDFSEDDLTGYKTMRVRINDTSIADMTFYNFGRHEYSIRFNPETFFLTERQTEIIHTELSGVKIYYLE